MIGMKKIVLLVSSLMLACSAVNADMVRYLDGHGMEAEMSMPSSKGHKGGKSSKGSEMDSITTAVEEDDHEEETHHDSSTTTSSGKGGGKGMSGDDEEYSSSGKGKGKGGSSKGGSSKGGSSKSSKKSGKKSSKKGGTRAPSAPSAPTPTPPIEPTTPSPTSAESIAIRPLPYTLAYTIEGTPETSEADWAQVAEVTRVYLEEFMIAEFSQSSLTNLDDFLTVLEGEVEITAVSRGIYRSTGLFNPSSIFLPTVRELNQLLDAAFAGENGDEYLARVRSLPSSNPFSNTVSVTKGIDDLLEPTADGSAEAGAGFVTAGVAAAASGMVVLGAGLLLLKRRRDDEGLEDPYEKSFGKNLKGDTTITGETCGESIDESTAWRKESPYATEDLDDEFEDEPLHSDDELDLPRGPPSRAFAHGLELS